MRLSALVFGLLCLLYLALPVQAANLTSIPAASRFEEPLVATTATTPNEDAALLDALTRSSSAAIEDNVNVFLATHPQSGWAMALYTNLGLSYYHQGRFSTAIETWERAWKLGKPVVEPKAKALVDRALGELMRMHARLGHVDRLTALFAEMGNRAVTGSATEAVAGAREGLWLMRNKPGIAFLCGPKALKNLLLTQGAKAKDLPFIDAYQSSSTGLALSEVDQLATQAKLAHKIIHRTVGQAIPVPAIVHWKVDHYAAIVGQKNGYYHIQDPTFGQDLWVTRAVIDSEASGYFLVPNKTQLDKGWRPVQLAEAEHIRGMGTTITNDPSATKPQDEKAKPPNANCGMCGYNIHEMLVSLNLTDTPVGYAPPKGSAVYTTLTYNQREASQPANFSYFNVGQKWTLNWLSFIQDDPAVPGASVRRIVAGGGTVDYTNYNSSTGAFDAERWDKSVLVRTLSPLTYERRLADGSVEVYAQSDAATVAPRRIFLTKMIDPVGNTLTLNYDTQLRLTSITDATGRNTTFSYGLTAQPLLITAITDPFGRSAQLTYDGNGRLSSITDVIGIPSSFHYNTSSLIDSKTTPYGTTSFDFDDSSGNQRWLEATDPLGFKERVEYVQEVSSIPFTDPDTIVPQGIVEPFNMYLNSRNTFYWDKHAFQSGIIDYTTARIKHWTHLASNTAVTANTVESIKYPLENRIWHNYPNQITYGTGVTGSLDKPNRTGRVLDDGSTQLTQTDYNDLGNVIREVDALGREVVYEYATNQIDVLRIKRKTSATSYVTLAELTYNSHHQPLTDQDAAGQITTYTYNAAGQLTKETNALNQSTSYIYNALGYLTSVVDANNVTALILTYTTAGNVASRTDSEGHVTQYSYDAFNRLVTTTYPDGTTRTNTWDKLDLVAVKDRENRVTSYGYDALRNLISVTDPMGKIVAYDYYRNGALKSLTDANNNVTTWHRDLQSRLIDKTYPDGKKDLYDYETTTSRLKSITDAKNQTKQLSYFNDNQLKQISYLNALVPTANVSYEYDNFFPRKISMTDGTGMTQYQYYPIGSLGALQLKQSDGAYTNDTIGYQYDELGRVTTRTIDTTNDTFSYDTLGRITNHTSPLGTFVRSYLGDTDQQTGEHKQNAPNIGMGTDWQYDSNLKDRHLLSITHSMGKNFFYTTSPENDITNIHETSSISNDSIRDWLYHYDVNDRLTKATVTGGYNLNAYYQYNYDPANNIKDALSNEIGNTSYSVNNLNQIDWAGGSVFSYDANGSTTGDMKGRVYQWDADNRLVKISPKAGYTGATTTLQYDGVGRFTNVITTNGGTVSERRFLWCGDELCQSRTASDTIQEHFYEEGIHTLIPNHESTYAIKDHLGSVHKNIGINSQSVYAAFYYNPYGGFYRSSQAGTNLDEFRYAGMFYLPEAALYFTRYRAYDPSTGRWLSRDPIAEEGGINLYGYVGGNAVNLVDPTGESPSTNNICKFVKLPICKLKLVWDGCKWVWGKISGSADNKENPPQTPKIDPEKLQKELENLKNVERDLRIQLDNGRAQAAREIAQGKTPNPHGLGYEINTSIPNEIKDVEQRIVKINQQLGK